MKREIKFRAWDSETKEMSYDFLSKNWLRVCIESPYVEIMQYTGLKDRNGKEIYGMDICYDPNKEMNLVICYDSNQARYKAVPIDLYKANAGNGGWTGYEVKGYSEVIGNIYDNPDLLEGRYETNQA